MAQIGRRGLSPAEKSDVWKRWRSGESLSSIGRAINKDPGSVFGILRLQGGIAAGFTMRNIANQLGRSASTICREINRHGGIAHYRATEADARTWDLARRPKLCHLARNERLRKVVAQKLSIDWAPE